ncbi:MAG TPA: immunoglobulin domain-containing protein [Verrucomicrobiae bacterium]|jgi:hypothetical protein|nr:immunoglobulin domain-containing protein [Verrucomicrobiae bacterium]
MKTKLLRFAVLALGLAGLVQSASAQFIKIDDFVNSTVGNLASQTSDGPSNGIWHAVGSLSTIIVSNSPSLGVGQPGSGTPLTTNSAVATSVDGAAYVALPVAIASTNTTATFFMQFDMGDNLATNNVNWDLANVVSGDAGGANQMIELNANAPNRAGLTIRNSGAFVEMSADGVNVFTPLTNTVYNIWFVINNSAKSFVIYMQDANTNGADLPNLTRMQIATASGNTPTSFTTNAIGFRNTSGAALTQFVFGTGGGGNTSQYVYSLYEDPNFLDLTNPVTGVAPATLSPPIILAEPQPQQLFPGATAVFNVGASGGNLHYKWLFNGTPLTDGGNISGSGTSMLTISNISSASVANYSCVITNVNPGAYESTNTLPVALSLVTPSGAFQTAAATDHPLHYYAFDDTGDTSVGTEIALDYAGGDNGVYGPQAQNGANGINGPRPVPDGLTGFSASNFAAEFFAFIGASHVTVNSPWNLNTNTVTLTAWIFPTSSQDNQSGIIFNRGSGSDVNGLNISTSGNSTLGYTWNNDAGTTSWDSGLQPPVSQWSLVALVVTPTNATISMFNTSGILSSTHVFNHVVVPFSGTTLIGDDSGGANGARAFIGAIDEVAVFNQALTSAQLQGLFNGAAGTLSFPPTNSVALITPSPIYPGQSAQFSSIVGGSDPITYTWQINGANVTDGQNSIGFISGSTTPDLTISNLAVADAGQTYNVTLVTHSGGMSYTSAVPAMLSVTMPNPAQTIFTLGFEASGTDWNTATNWSDNNPASLSAFSEPGSTYEIAPGTLERTPASTNAVFPGNVLVIEGDGVLIDGNLAAFATNATTGELRLKQSGATMMTNLGLAYVEGGSVTFPDLQLNGGQLDNGTSSKVTLNGKIEVLANSAIYADSGANGAVRSIQINAQLTGAGTITYGYLSTQNVSSNDLIVSGASNTFSGQWNVLQGTLLGNTPGSLGTNTITVASSGALETTYNINNPKGTLALSGQMYLYTDDTFLAASINGLNVPAGVYTFAQLRSLYPTNFPANWTLQLGSTTGTNTGTGSLTILTTLLPQFTQQPTPASLSLYPGQSAQFTTAVVGATSYQWWFTNMSGVAAMLNDNSTFSGTKTTSLTISSVSAGNAGTYALVAENLAGSTASAGATLSLLAPSSATTITMSVVETAGQDWETGVNWSDGNPASVSEFAEPGSTYEILAGATLRTPAVSANTSFPGNQLIVDSGASLLLEHIGARSIAFADLQLNGASLDNGADGLATITGQMDVTGDVTIYTDTNSPPGLVLNFDVPGGIGGTNYAGLGAFPDSPNNTNWNPIVQTSGNGTTDLATNSDGVTTSSVTLSLNTGLYQEGNVYGGYGPFDNSARSTPNTPDALEGNYLFIDNTSVPDTVINTITSTLNNVPAGTYNLYLYGNNGGGAGGDVGQQNDWGTIFTVSSDLTATMTLSTSNRAASFTSNEFILGADYVVFSNIVVGGGGTITFTFTANTNATSPDYAGPNSQGAFNGLQLVTAVSAAPGPRPFEVDSKLTGGGVITYNEGDTNFMSALKIGGAANTYTGQWNVQQGALLGGGANSLGTNSITVGPTGALETSYNINDTSAGLVLNGAMFLHQNDTFHTLTVNGVNVSPGTYSFAQLNHSFPASFPATWPLQTGSSINTGSGGITVLTGPAATAQSARITGSVLSGNQLTLSGNSGVPTGSYHVLTSTNITLPQMNWSVVTNSAFDASGNFNIVVPYSSSDRQRFYSITSP